MGERWLSDGRMAGGRFGVLLAGRHFYPRADGAG